MALALSYIRIVLSVCLSVLISSETVFAECSKTLKIGYSNWIRVEAAGGDEVVDYGLDFEILDAVFALAGCDFETEAIPLKRLLKAIELGQIDGTMGASLMVVRQEYAWFTAPYRRETIAMFMLPNKIKAFTPKLVDDLGTSDLLFGLGFGSWHGEKFERMVEGDPTFQKRLIYTNDFRQLFQTLRRGRLDVVLIDRSVGRYLLKLYGIADRIAAHPFIVHSNQVHMMLSKKSVSLVDAKNISRAFGRFRESEAYREIFEKYAQ